MSDDGGDGETDASGERIWRHPMLERRDELGTMYRAIEYRADGTLLIIGADYGDGVAQVFGLPGYDFFRKFSVSEVARLVELMGEPDDVDLREAITSHFGSTDELERFATEHGIPGTFTSWNSD